MVTSMVIKTNRENVIEEALRVVTGDRCNTYGKPEDNFKRAADLWNAHLTNTGRDGNMGAKDVAMFMILLKIARLAESPNHRDSIVDVIGYAACYADIVGE